MFLVNKKSEPLPKTHRTLLQLLVLRPRIRQHREIRIGVFPESEEILVRRARLARITLQKVSPRQIQPRQSILRIPNRNSAVIQNTAGTPPPPWSRP